MLRQCRKHVFVEHFAIWEAQRVIGCKRSVLDHKILFFKSLYIHVSLIQI